LNAASLWADTNAREATLSRHIIDEVLADHKLAS